MPAIVVAAFFAVIIGLNLLYWLLLPKLSPLRRAGYRAEAHPPAGDTQHRFDPQQSWHGRGGARVGRKNATYPLARIDIDSSCASIRSPWGTVTIDRSEVTGVRVIGHISPGIHFDSADGRFDGLIFWTFSATEVLSQFRGFGWPVPSPSATVTGVTDPDPTARFPRLPPPPTSPVPRSVPPPPSPPISPQGSSPVHRGSHTPKRAPDRGSFLATCQFVGHYLSAAIVVICLAVLAASFLPALRGRLDMTILAFALFPVVFVLFALALFSLHDTPRAHRPYRPHRLFSALPLPESWPRRLLLIAVMVGAAMFFFSATAGPWTNPRHVNGNATVDWNGTPVPAGAEKYEQVRAVQDRPPLAILLVFATFSYGILAEVDARTASKSGNRSGDGSP